jgi:hypothetical protein
VNDRTCVMLSACAGAVIGGFAGYLMWTERGRELRADLEPRVDELVGEAKRLGLAFDRTRRAVSDGWRSFAEMMEEQRSRDSWDTRPH